MSRKKTERRMDATYFKSLNGLIDRLFDEAYRQRMSFLDLGERSGVCAATISKLAKRETKYPQFRTVELIAFALGGAVSFSNKQPWRVAIKIRWTPDVFKAKRKAKPARKGKAA